MLLILLLCFHFDNLLYYQLLDFYICYYFQLYLVNNSLHSTYKSSGFFAFAVFFF
jgi:hypothetical protein